MRLRSFIPAPVAVLALGVSMQAVAVTQCLTDAQAQAQQLGPANLYVDGSLTAESMNCGLTPATPCLNPYTAINKAGPGTTIHLKASTTYTTPIYIANKKGSFAHPIVITGDTPYPNQTKISVSGGNGIMIDGLMGPNGTLMDADADACAAYFTIQNLEITATGAPGAVPYAGINISNAHHIQVLDNYLHGSSGPGVGAGLSDWLDFERNIVQYNSGETMNSRTFTSGIGTYWSKDHKVSYTDPNPVSRILIMNNKSSFNQNAAPAPGCIAANGQACGNTDGNGIIIDDAKHTQTYTPPPGSTKKVGPLSTYVKAYTGHTLIYNNVVNNNGGRGINVYESENVWVTNNTAFYNMRDTHDSMPNQGEIMALDSNFVVVWSNIAYSDGQGAFHSNPDPQPSKTHYAVLMMTSTTPPAGTLYYVDHNLMWDAPQDIGLKIYTTPGTTQIGNGAGVDDNQFGNPQFKNLTYLPYDAHVSTTSPALKFNTPPRPAMQSYMYVSPDIEFVARPTGATSVTAGAYQTPKN